MKENYWKSYRIGGTFGRSERRKCQDETENSINHGRRSDGKFSRTETEDVFIIAIENNVSKTTFGISGIVGTRTVA